MRKIILGDCIKVMEKIKDKSIDMILCDLPYGTTACKWDVVISLDELWEQYKRIIKDNGAIALTASQPFTTMLISSNIQMFKYCWVWNKGKAGNFVLSKYQPLRVTEDIVIFNVKQYNPQMVKAKKENIRPRSKDYKKKYNGTQGMSSKVFKWSTTHNKEIRYPINIINIKSTTGECNNLHRLHPTQKPVALFEYLIRTYTNKNDLILDNCAGSGTTGIACINLKRNFILIDNEKKYYKLMKKRIMDHIKEIKIGTDTKRN